MLPPSCGPCYLGRGHLLLRPRGTPERGQVRHARSSRTCPVMGSRSWCYPKRLGAGTYLALALMAVHPQCYMCAPLISDRTCLAASRREECEHPPQAQRLIECFRASANLGRILVSHRPCAFRARWTRGASLPQSLWLGWTPARQGLDRRHGCFRQRSRVLSHGQRRGCRPVDMPCR